jgi:hypothetical protein
MRRIRLRRVGRFAADLTATKDPDKKMALTLAFADKYFLAPLAEKLAADHPERKDLRVYAFLAKYFCAAKEDFPTDEGFPGALDVALKAEPGNAALLLFRVPYRKPTMSREGEPPMTEEELRPFREACHATGFNTYRWWKLEEAYRVMFRSLGGWTSINVGPHTPSITGYHLNVMRRVQSTFSAYAAEGKTDDAVKLLEDCRALVALMNRESPVMLSNIIADFYPISVYPKVLQSIAQSGRKDLIDATIGAIEAAHRRAYQRMLLYNEVSENVVVLLPVRRLKEAALDIELGTGVVERVVGSLMARRKEQMVKAALDDIESQLRWGGDPQRVNVESIIQLGDLKDAKAVPTLEKLAEFKDITTRLLAERALARIAKTETP